MAAPMSSFKCLVLLSRNARFCASSRVLSKIARCAPVTYKSIQVLPNPQGSEDTADLALLRRHLVRRRDFLNVTHDFTNLQRFSTSAVRWDDVTEQPEKKMVNIPEETEETKLMQALEYLESEEYFEKYGDKPVWANYKRNHKGRVAPMKTRKRCIRGHGEKQTVCGNPCPICRDTNLLVHYKNVKLLEQFICPHSWDIYSTFRTGVCQQQYKKLCVTIEKAKQHGLIPYSVPFIEFKYDDYYQPIDGNSSDETIQESAKARCSLHNDFMG